MVFVVSKKGMYYYGSHLFFGETMEILPHRNFPPYGNTSRLFLPVHRDLTVTNKTQKAHQLSSAEAFVLWLALFCMLMQVSQCFSSKLQCTLKASAGWPPLGSIQYSPTQQGRQAQVSRDQLELYADTLFARMYSKLRFS